MKEPLRNVEANVEFSEILLKTHNFQLATISGVIIMVTLCLIKAQGVGLTHIGMTHAVCL